MIYRSFCTTSCATGVLVLTLAIPLAAQRSVPAQRGGPPRAETPQLVVAALSSTDPRVGVAAAEAIRKRMQDEHSATDVYLTPRPTIEATLKSSGYPTDSALGASDLVLLAKNVRGDYALSGDVERTPSGMRTSLRLLTQRGSQIIAEPIAPVLGSDLGDVAKQVDRAVSDALRGLAFHRDCMNAFVAGDYARALATAQAGLKIRPTSAAINQCVLSTLRAMHASADSIIAVATAITAVDSSNVVAWANLSDAYSQKNDAAHALEATRMLHQLDSANVDVTSALIDRIVAAGQTGPAAALLDTALRASPGDARLLRKQWLLQLRLGQYAGALKTGTSLIAADTTAATEDYFERQLAAAKAASDTASTRQLALAAARRFPKNVSFALVLARAEVDQGAAHDAIVRLDQVLSVDPKNDVAWQLMIAAHAKANAPDSAVAAGRRAISAGAAKDAIGASLLSVVAPALRTAQASQKRADWDVALRVAQSVDSIASTPNTSYYVGIAAYQVAADEVQGLSAFATKKTPTRADRLAACESSTRAEALLGTVSMALPKGGSVDPTTAGKVLGAVTGMSEFVSSVKQASCRARDD